MTKSIPLIYVTSAVVFVFALAARMTDISPPWTIVTLSAIVGFLGVEIAGVLRNLSQRIEQIENQQKLEK